MRKTIPTWITIVSGLITLLGLYVGFSIYFSPATSMPVIDFTSPDVKFLANMWAARQISIAAIIGISLIKQSRSMLQISLAAYFLMTFQDIVIGIVKSDNSLAVGSAVFCGISVLMLFILRKNKIRSKVYETTQTN